VVINWLIFNRFDNNVLVVADNFSYTSVKKDFVKPVRIG